MSLPDTIFIFVLALIIFGPKKLPEIGRQLGKLVGEFRRASNEFKFQIEEELRQADLMDSREKQKTIAPPAVTNTPASETAAAASGTESGLLPGDPDSNIPIGQHPNIEAISTAELNPPDAAGIEAAAVQASTPASETAPVIHRAAGSEARTSVPFAPENSAASTLPLSAEHAAPEAETAHG